MIKSLGTDSAHLASRKICKVSLLGAQGTLETTSSADGLHVKVPDAAPSDHSNVLRIETSL